MTIFLKVDNIEIHMDRVWPIPYGDDVIDHDRKLKKVQPHTNLPYITIKKELGRYILLVLRKNTKLIIT